MKDQRAGNVTGILHKEERGVQVQVLSLSTHIATITSADSCHTDNSGYMVTINMLPDDVLLEIFDTCRKKHNVFFGPLWRWHWLVHVCERWRQVIFGSPRTLDLQILYFHGTPVRKSLDIWPPFPIAIQYCSFSTFTHDADNLFAALENRGRIRQVDLYLTGLQLGEVATVMQQPFLALLPFSGHGKIGDCLCFPVDS